MACGPLFGEIPLFATLLLKGSLTDSLEDLVDTAFNE